MQQLKWPEELVFIRHGLSAYNQLKIDKAVSKLYALFKKNFENKPSACITRLLAEVVKRRFALPYGDDDTPLDPSAKPDCIMVGKTMAQKLQLPDVIICSPYLRTRQTLEFLIQGWPELSKVLVYHEDRVREKEHGMANLCSDWRVFHALYPDQKKLYDKLGPYWYRYPQGENTLDVRDRIRSWTSTLVREFSGKRILVVTHHLTILSMRANFERLTPEDFNRIDEHEKPINAGVTIYRCNPDIGKQGKLELAVYNEKWY